MCGHQGDSNINVKLILSVVAMVPFPFIIGGCNNQYFMIEQIGLDVVETDVVTPPLDDT